MFSATPSGISRAAPRGLLTISSTPFGRTLLAAAGMLLIGGCQDLPTTPEAVQQIAGGAAWVAVPEPANLPTLDTWLPYVADGRVGETPVVSRIRMLREESRGALAEGRLAWAAELDREAIRLAVLSLDRPLDVGVLFDGLHALDVWIRQVETTVDLGVYGEMGESLEMVRRSRAIAAAAIETGDTTTAVLRISDAAERVRSHAPMHVALRVLGRVEARIRERESESATAARALHLVRSARLELVSGDPTRALRRALYALQLVEGRQVTGVSDLPDG